MIGHDVMLGCDDDSVDHKKSKLLTMRGFCQNVIGRNVMLTVLMTRKVNCLPCLVFDNFNIKTKLTTSRLPGTTKLRLACVVAFSSSFKFQICLDVIK